MSLSCRSSSMPLKPFLFEAMSHWSRADVIVKPFLFDAIQCRFIWSHFSSMPFHFNAISLEAVPLWSRVVWTRADVVWKLFLYDAVSLLCRSSLKLFLFEAVVFGCWNIVPSCLGKGPQNPGQLHCMPFEILRLRRGSLGLFESIHCMRSVDRVSLQCSFSHWNWCRFSKFGWILIIFCTSAEIIQDVICCLMQIKNTSIYILHPFCIHKSHGLQQCVCFADDYM